MELFVKSRSDNEHGTSLIVFCLPTSNIHHRLEKKKEKRCETTQGREKETERTKTDNDATQRLLNYANRISVLLRDLTLASLGVEHRTQQQQHQY